MTDYVQAGSEDPAVLARAAGDQDQTPRVAEEGPARSVTVATEPPSRAGAWSRRYRRAAVGLDLGGAALAGALGYFSRFGDMPARQYALASLAVPLMWACAVALAHGYESRFLGVSSEEYRAVARAAAVLVAVVALASYAGQLEIARQYVVITVPAAMVLSLVGRRALRKRLSRLRSQGQCLQRTVVIGRADSAADLIAQIQNAPGHGMEVVAACVSNLDTRWTESSHLAGVPVFGFPEEALSAVDLFDAEVVAVTSHPDLVGHSLRRLAWSLEERKVDLVVSPGILEVAGPRLSIRPAAGMPLLHVERPVMAGSRRVVKSLVDKVLTLGLILAAFPALLVVGLLVRLDSRGPIFFRQKRVGAQGEEFDMLKFRTMVVDAEARLAELTAQHDGNAVLFKMKDDPRVTRIGKVLRRYSVDELPQLVNVLKGQMSLVGPRPPLPREVAGYEPDAIRRLRVRPGLTGLWQVSGRSDLSWEESLRLDLWYVDNWSLVLDLQILFRTARAVLRGSGAY